MYQGAFKDIDGSPSKSNIINGRTCCGANVFFRWATNKRPEFELFDLNKDEACLFNMMEKRDYEKIASELKDELLKKLIQTRDPRVVGPGKEVFDSYKRYSHIRKFPKPE